MDMERVLRRFADAVLCDVLGRGHWHAYRNQIYTPPNNALSGLEVGQPVYTYDDEEGIVEERVSIVHEGIGYVAYTPYQEKPTLWPVTGDKYATSRSEAARIFRKDINNDIEYIEAAIKRLPELQKCLELQSEDV